MNTAKNAAAEARALHDAFIAESSGLSLAEAVDGPHELTGDAARHGHGHHAGHH